MKFSRLLLAGLCTVSLGALSLPGAVGAEIGIYFNAPPPPARYERVPPPRRGYIWVPGYWDAKGHRHVWRSGHWERERSGYYYSAPSWVQRDDRWELQRGRWQRGDRDHDGIPNRYDADRDGDGVSNRRDDAPNNPRRR